MTSPLPLEFVVNSTRVSRETGDKLRAYHDLLAKWRTRINLVSDKSWRDPWRRHFLDSAQLLSHFPDPTDHHPLTVIDMGSGAGFPGLVLAILAQDSASIHVLDVHLVESDHRKCIFLREAARLTGASVTIHNRRLEDIPPATDESPDYPGIPRATVITARGCARLDRLIGYAQPLLAEGGTCLFLKGESAKEELTEARKTWNMRCIDMPSESDPRGVILKISEISRGRP